MDGTSGRWTRRQISWEGATITPRIDIQVIGAGCSVALTALLDTGFNGEVCLPTDIAVSLGLELVARRWVEYADGRQERELVFIGDVRFLDEVRSVEIVLTEGEEALIGTGLLADLCVVH